MVQARRRAAIARSVDPATSGRAVRRRDEPGKPQPIYFLVVVGAGGRELTSPAQAGRNKRALHAPGFPISEETGCWFR